MKSPVRKRVFPLWVVVVNWLLERPWQIFDKAQMQYELTRVQNYVKQLPEPHTPWEEALHQMVLKWSTRRIAVLKQALAEEAIYIQFGQGYKRGVPAPSSFTVISLSGVRLHERRESSESSEVEPSP